MDLVPQRVIQVPYPCIDIKFPWWMIDLDQLDGIGIVLRTVDGASHELDNLRAIRSFNPSICGFSDTFFGIGRLTGPRPTLPPPGSTSISTFVSLSVILEPGFASKPFTFHERDAHRVRLDPRLW